VWHSISINTKIKTIKISKEKTIKLKREVQTKIRAQMHSNISSKIINNNNNTFKVMKFQVQVHLELVKILLKQEQILLQIKITLILPGTIK
jgi:hypothetical protein